MDSARSLDTDSPKARQILEGATATFLELGFEGASVDEIARRAGVSKGTLYNYFPDKSALFAAIVERECEEQARRVFTVDSGATDVEATLRGIARQFVAFLVSPFAENIFRVVLAEVPRFPELGRAFYDSGPDLGVRRLSQFLAAANARGVLEIDDPELAAQQFIELCKADLFYKRVLGVKRSASQAEIDRIADAAVTFFLRATRPGCD